MSTAPDIDGMATRVDTYIKELTNLLTDTPVPLFATVYDLIDRPSLRENIPHPLPSCGYVHVDDNAKPNMILGGGFEQEGDTTWMFVIQCASATRGAGMRGPTGARSLSGQLWDALNNFYMDGEGVDGGNCPLSVIRRTLLPTSEETVREVCGYTVVATHPTVVN